MKTINSKKTRPLIMRILDTILDILSIIVFPFIFSGHFKITHLTGYNYVIIFITLIFIYKDIFIPKNPNKYFDSLFLVIFLSMSIVFSFKLNTLITLISIFQLLLFILAKIVKNNSPIVTDLIFNFVTPIFLMIILIYSLTKFVSISVIIMVLLINTFSLTSNYIEISYKSLFTIIVILILTIVMCVGQYITLFSGLSMFATLLLAALIKYYFNIEPKSSFTRLFISAIQFFI